MKLFTSILLFSLLFGSPILFGAEVSHSASGPFDQYGRILWEDEQARLDNFAIQLQQLETPYVGYILVYDATGGCPGEATARAIRAKRYLTEHRNIPSNRVIWRRDGYEQRISTTLLLLPPGITLPFPFREEIAPQVDGPLTRACKARLTRIKRSRW